MGRNYTNVKPCVYLITLPNGKQYVGQTTRGLPERKLAHLYSTNLPEYANNKLYIELEKFNKEDIAFELLGEFETKEEAYAAEIENIKKYNTYFNGLNSTIGGIGNNGYSPNLASRENISAGQKLRFSKEENREATKNATLKWIEDNPEQFKQDSITRAEALRRPEVRVKIAESLSKYREEHPEYREIASASILATYTERPEIKTAISRSLGGTSIDVYRFGKFVSREKTLMSVSRKYKLSSGNVGMVLSGKRTHTHFYKFVRVYDENISPHLYYIDTVPGAAAAISKSSENTHTGSP